MIPDATLGGYLQKHSRPPAFQGSDGASYSVEPYITESEGSEMGFSGALLFVRWSDDGSQAVGHLETQYLFAAKQRSEVEGSLFAMTLLGIKGYLEQLIAARKELPDW